VGGRGQVPGAMEGKISKTGTEAAGDQVIDLTGEASGSMLSRARFMQMKL